MPVLGSVEPFDGSDQFESYLERVELYFVANSIGECPADAANRVVEAAAKKKLAIFLTVIGKDAYRVAQTLCSLLCFAYSTKCKAERINTRQKFSKTF